MADDYRARSIGQALRYKGRLGMWTWMLHRVTGLGILAFLVLHVVDTAIVVYWPDLYDHALGLYRHPVFRVAELAIFFAVLFHALNGLRIIVQDFWPIAMMHQRRLAVGASVLTAVLILPVAWIMLAPLVGLADEPGTARHRAREAARGEDPAFYQGAPAQPGYAPPVIVEGGR
ncbi:MAG TPA: succinate dehydrogenase, cytochrome b556 subunit [Longimicrobium sp.]|nr:succinate dehydrogenase, cytochrome b556 subunit [Longimicrobium sp.]